MRESPPFVAPFECRAPAKINTFLRVLGKREDGFHELVTVMAATTLADRLRFSPLPAPGVTELVCDDPRLPVDGTNLVLRAAHLMRAKTGFTAGVKIELFKHIPFGAGLGGGSSDAAATMWALNRIFDFGLSAETLADWSASLGSDIPFFFHGPVAACLGRGERVVPLQTDTVVRFVILFPDFAVPTPRVFQALNAKKGQIPPGTLHALPAGIVSNGRWLEFDVASFRNDLEPAARQAFPPLEAVFQATDTIAVQRRMLTGSGSAILFFDSLEQLEIISTELRARRLGTVIPARTLLSGEACFDQIEEWAT